MSTADDAYDEWRETWKYPKPVPQIEAAFMAGYRRALEDAAKEIYNGAGDPEQAFYNYGLHPWLMDRADRVDAEDGGR